MNIKAIAAVGIKITQEEYEEEFDCHFRFDDDLGQNWLNRIKPYLIKIQDDYVLSNNYLMTDNYTSILELKSIVNYSANEEIIMLFKTDFITLDISTHQLDFYLGLQIM